MSATRPLWRATAAAVIVLGAGLIDHRTPPVNVLAVAAIGIILVSPLAVFDHGFLLTFGATLGIVLGVSRVAAALARLPARWVDPPPRWVAPPLTLLAATLCAEGALMPIGATLFARVSLAGLLLNFFAIPLMTVTQLAGLTALALAPLSRSLSSVAGYISHLAATGLVESTRLLDVCPWLVFRVRAPAVPVLGVYYGALSVLVWGGGSARVRVGGQVLLAMAAIWIVSAPSRPPVMLTGRPPAGWMRVTFLDVGQADATLVQTPGGRSLLVDAGGSISARSDIGSRVVAPALWALGVRRLDVAVLTHGDPDHIGGMGTVLGDFEPREVWEGVPVPGYRPLETLRAAADAAGARWRRVLGGDRFDLDGVAILVVHPPHRTGSGCASVTTTPSCWTCGLDRWRCCCQATSGGRWKAAWPTHSTGRHSALSRSRIMAAPGRVRRCWSRPRRRAWRLSAPVTRTRSVIRRRRWCDGIWTPGHSCSTPGMTAL